MSLGPSGGQFRFGLMADHWSGFGVDLAPAVVVMEPKRTSLRVRRKLGCLFVAAAASRSSGRRRAKSRAEVLLRTATGSRKVADTPNRRLVGPLWMFSESLDPAAAWEAQHWTLAIPKATASNCSGDSTANQQPRRNALQQICSSVELDKCRCWFGANEGQETKP